MATDSITISEVASAVRFALFLEGGRVGPKEFSSVLGRLLVRDMDFLVSLAREVRMSGLEMFDHEQMLKAQEDDRVRRHRMLATCREHALEILGVVARLKTFDHRWELFEFCVSGQTPRGVARRMKSRAEWSVLDDLAAVASVIENSVGPEKIETLLTFRRLLA